MYIVISKAKTNNNIEVKEMRRIEECLEYMEKQVKKDYKCDLARKIDTDVEMVVKVTIADHEEI